MLVMLHYIKMKLLRSQASVYLWLAGNLLPEEDAELIRSDVEFKLYRQQFLRCKLHPKKK